MITYYTGCIHVYCHKQILQTVLFLARWASAGRDEETIQFCLSPHTSHLTTPHPSPTFSMPKPAFGGLRLRPVKQKQNVENLERVAPSTILGHGSEVVCSSGAPSPKPRVLRRFLPEARLLYKSVFLVGRKTTFKICQPPVSFLFLFYRN